MLRVVQVNIDRIVGNPAASLGDLGIGAFLIVEITQSEKPSIRPRLQAMQSLLDLTGSSRELRRVKMAPIDRPWEAEAFPGPH